MITATVIKPEIKIHPFLKTMTDKQIIRLYYRIHSRIGPGWDLRTLHMCEPGKHAAYRMICAEGYLRKL